MMRELPWYKAEEPHKELVRLGESLAGHQHGRRDRARAALTLWAGSEKWSLSGVQSGSTGLDSYFGATALTNAPYFNLVAASVDTLHAHLVREQVLPWFQTEAGDYELQSKAKGMQRAAVGVMQKLGYYGGLLADRVCRDGLIHEGGGVKFSPDYANQRVIGERVNSWDVYVSERDAKLGTPRSMIHMSAVDRGVLRAFFEGDEDAQQAIDDAENAPAEYTSHEPAVDGLWCDQVLVWEAWHLPSGRVDRKDRKSFGFNKKGELDPSIDPGHDGRHVIAIAGHTLVNEPWVYDYFPIAFFLPDPEPLGFWSRSIPAQLAPAQLQLIKLGERINRIVDLHAVPTLLLWRKALVNKGHITNDIAKILETSVPPSQAAYYLNPNSVPAELFQREQQIIQWGREQVGISELSMFAQKPGGIQHAPALVHLQDTESLRHNPKYTAWQRFHVDSARCIVDCLRLLYERDKSLEVMFSDSKQLRRIKWSECDLDENQYHLRIDRTNFLSKGVAARTQQVIDLATNQIISPKAGARMLDAPDVESELGDATAPRAAIEMQLDAIGRGETGDRTQPLPYMDLQQAETLTAQRINRAIADGESWETIDVLAQYYEDARELRLRQMAEEAQAAQGQAPPPVPGPGAAPPMGPPPEGMAPPQAA